MKEDFHLPLEQKEKFAEVYKTYHKGMLRYAFRLIKDKSAAEDIIQEAFIKTAKCMDKINQVESSQTQNFLFTIVKNCSIDYLRKREKELKQLCSLEEEILDGYSEDILDYMCRTEKKAEIYLKINQLKKTYKEVLLMKYEQELSDREMAERLNISAENVRIRICRAKKALSVRIRQEPF